DGTPTDGATDGTPTDGATDGTPTDGTTDGTPTDGATDGTPADGATDGTPADGATDGTPADGATDGTPADADTADWTPTDIPSESFWVDDDGDTFAEGDGDCDDTDPRVYPDATGHIEGVDYDCDGKREYLATLMLTVDDWYERLCVNDIDVAIDATTSRDWYGAETYTVVMESGLNVVGVHGVDLFEVISAFMMRIQVAGLTYLTTGISAGEPDTTPWRYSPDPDESPQADWCMASYDDSAWGPARYVAEWGASPWGPSPPEFSGVGADWIWDDRPASLADAWFRIKLDLPY
ncbi:MAG: putative metal-binding motif-containing protein, partial [Deltaproteobacteria bacterium]|nr:putative metal-binding motif-containing protein [Deltaproteobacteria bacterium]